MLATGKRRVWGSFGAPFAPAPLGRGEFRQHDARYERPAEVDALIGDPSKAERQLGWKARTDWRRLAEIMVDADIASLDDQLAGHSVRLDRG